MQAEKATATPGFTPVSDFCKKARKYGVDEDLILDAIKAGLMQAYAPSASGMVWLPCSQSLDYRDCYVKDDDVESCINALPKMVHRETMHCRWEPRNDIFITGIEPCDIYIPSIIQHNPYLPNKLIDSSIIRCACDLNNNDTVELVYRSEHDRERALVYYEFPEYLPADQSYLIDTHAAFSLQIRIRNVALAKQHEYYPVRYVKMPLPE